MLNKKCKLFGIDDFGLTSYASNTSVCWKKNPNEIGDVWYYYKSVRNGETKDCQYLKTQNGISMSTLSQSHN